MSKWINQWKRTWAYHQQRQDKDVYISRTHGETSIQNNANHRDRIYVKHPQKWNRFYFWMNYPLIFLQSHNLPPHLSFSFTFISLNLRCRQHWKSYQFRHWKYIIKISGKGRTERRKTRFFLQKILLTVTTRLSPS